MQQTRRDLLQKSAQLTAVGAVVSTAGCLRQIPVVGPMIAGPPLSPKKWVGAPDLFGDSDHNSFYYIQIDKLLNNKDNLADSYEEDLTSQDDGTVMAAADVDPEDVTTALAYDLFGASIAIRKANFNKSDVISELEDDDFEEADTHKGYTVLTGGDGSDFQGQGAAVTGDKIIQGGQTADSDPEEVLKTAIDVGKGEEDRYVDESDDMKELLNKLGIGPLTVASTNKETEENNPEQGDFEGQVADGTRYNINGETTKLKQVYLFSDADQVDTGDVEDYVEKREDADDSTLSEADSTSVSQNGRAAIITAKLPTDELFAEDS